MRAITDYAGVYERHTGMAETSARAVLPLILDGARTVIDVGCGAGAWAKVASELRASVVGLDGEWVSSPLIREFRSIDISQPFTFGERFDLAVSMEVGEHLPPGRADSFVKDLCALSDRVLFSAAIPGQGGHEHVNEQWPDYWMGLFRQHGYGTLDVIRPAVWDDDRVAAWYAQNSFLYVKGAADRLVFPARAVHPSVYEWSRTLPPSLAPAPSLRQFPAALRRSMKHRLR